MTSITRRSFLSLVGAGAGAYAGLGFSPLGALAQAADPVKNLKIIVGFAPGGTVDTVGRRVAHKFEGGYARGVVVENRTGAGGQIAVQTLKNMPGDGTALLMTPSSMLAIYPHIYKKLSYDPLADLTPVGTACTIEFGLGVGPMVPASVTTLPQFLDWVKANPASGNFGSPAAGSIPHFIGELVGRAGGVQLSHVAYRGSQPAMVDMLGGQIAAVSTPIGDFLQHLPGSKVRLLATSGATRSRFTPSVPTFTELGYKDLQFSEWFGFFGPAKMPAETVKSLNAALRTALVAKDTVDAFTMMGIEAAPSTAEELGARLKRDLERWGPIVKRIGFTAD